MFVTGARFTDLGAALSYFGVPRDVIQLPADEVGEEQASLVAENQDGRTQGLASAPVVELCEDRISKESRS